MEKEITYDEVMSLMKYHHDKIKESEYWNNFDNIFFDEVKKSFEEIISLSIAPPFRQYMGIYPEGYSEVMVYGNPYYPMLGEFIHDLNYYLTRGKYISRTSDDFQKMVTYLQTYLSVVHMCIDNVPNPEIKIPQKIYYIGVREFTCDNKTGYHRVQIYKTKESQEKLLGYYQKKIEYEWDYFWVNYYTKIYESIKSGENPSYIFE